MFEFLVEVLKVISFLFEYFTVTSTTHIHSQTLRKMTKLPLTCNDRDSRTSKDFKMSRQRP